MIRLRSARVSVKLSVTVVTAMVRVGITVMVGLRLSVTVVTVVMVSL